MRGPVNKGKKAPKSQNFQQKLGNNKRKSEELDKKRPSDKTKNFSKEEKSPKGTQKSSPNKVPKLSPAHKKSFNPSTPKSSPKHKTQPTQLTKDSPQSSVNQKRSPKKPTPQKRAPPKNIENEEEEDSHEEDEQEMKDAQETKMREEQEAEMKQNPQRGTLKLITFVIGKGVDSVDCRKKAEEVGQVKEYKVGKKYARHFAKITYTKYLDAARAVHSFDQFKLPTGTILMANLAFEAKKNRLIVRNLPNMTEDELLKIANPFGAIIDIQIKGRVGFIEYLKKKNSAKKALKDMHNSTIKTRQVTVHFAVPKCEMKKKRES